MAFELQTVFFTVLILFALLVIQGTLVPLNQGLAWGLGSRDAAKDSTTLQARARRTIANHMEGMWLFIPLAFIVTLLELSSELTIWGAGIYLAGRLTFAPLYLLGVPYLRSAAWGVAVVGTLMLAYPVLLAVI